MTANSIMIPESRYAVRSISMPARSHPNIPKIEAELQKLKVWEESSTTLKAETICVGLAGLGGLYNCVEELLQLPVTQQSLIHHKKEKWVDDVLDGSVRLLDVCGSARDLLSEMKENAQDLRSALRRRGEESSKEEKVGSFVCFRKKMKKCINKSVGELKKMDDKFVSSLYQDEHLKVVIRILREVRVTTVSILESLLAFMCAEPKTYKWSLVSKLLHKGQIATNVEETEDIGEIECVDAAVSSLLRHLSDKDVEGERVKAAQKGLETLERCIEGVEGGLEYVSRRLIQTRVTLLNIFTN